MYKIRDKCDAEEKKLRLRIIFGSLVLIFLYTASLGPLSVSGLPKDEFNPIKDSMEALGIGITDFYNDTNLISISGMYTGKDGLNAKVTVKLRRYSSSEDVREAYDREINSPLSCLNARDEPAMLYSKKSTEGNPSCYRFSTMIRQEDSGKYYRSNPWFSYEKYVLSGNYLLAITIQGKWDNERYNDGNYSRVVCTHGANSDCWVEYDENAYANYLKLLDSLRRETEALSNSIGERVTGSALPLMAPKGSNTSTAGVNESPAEYSVRIYSPSDGAILKQLFEGYFTISLWADVRGKGAENLYAVVTLPDGSKRRVEVLGDSIADIISVDDPSIKGGILKVDLYGEINSAKKLLASDSVRVSFISKEVPGDGIDNDLDGLTDCDDPDIATCEACVQQKKLEWAESLMERHIDYLKRMIEATPGMRSVYEVYIDELHAIHDRYRDDPGRMAEEMNAYMEGKVYQNQKINDYLSIFKDDPEKRYQLRQIAIKYRYDPIARDIAMRNFIYENSKSEAEKTATMNAILTGVLNPPKWLVGGQYGSGGALDWAQFVATNFETAGNTVKLKGAEKVKFFTTPTKIYLVALDAKALMDHANEVKKMNLDERTKVSIIVLDGATKIGKLLDPTGYFGNMADATVGSLINLRKKIEERNQGWFTWNGYVLHETSTPGIYEDYETGKKFKRVGGGWLGGANFVEVSKNG